MTKKKQKKSLKYFLSTALLLLLFAYNNGNFNTFLPDNLAVVPDAVTTNSDLANTSDHSIVISDRVKTHILYGDHRGGGHKYGMNKPCKSEFPKSWDDADIIESIKNVAANDNGTWRREDNGYYVTEKMHEGVKVRVVLGRDQTNVVTAYPLNQKRNACDQKKSSSNDNYNR